MQLEGSRGASRGDGTWLARMPGGQGRSVSSSEGSRDGIAANVLRGVSVVGLGRLPSSAVIRRICRISSSVLRVGSDTGPWSGAGVPSTLGDGTFCSMMAERA